jgi:hypothetical protein
MSAVAATAMLISAGFIPDAFVVRHLTAFLLDPGSTGLMQIKVRGQSASQA